MTSGPKSETKAGEPRTAGGREFKRRWNDNRHLECTAEIEDFCKRFDAKYGSLYAEMEEHDRFRNKANVEKKAS